MKNFNPSNMNLQRRDAKSKQLTNEQHYLETAITIYE